MKTKDIEIGQSYTDKNRSSIREVLSIEDNILIYKMMNTRYINRIGKEYKWETRRFAQWANAIYSKEVVLNDFFENPNKNKHITFKLKDEFTLKDFFKLDGLDTENINNFTIDNFKNVEIGDFSSAQFDEYDLIIKRSSFPCSREEIEKFFELT